MTSHKEVWAAISMRPMHGTAKWVAITPAVPADKRLREVFWVEALASQLDELRSPDAWIEANPEDSHGQDDVVVTLEGGASIGVQVTELTYELERQRQSQRRKYLERVLQAIEARGLRTTRRLLVKGLLPNAPRQRYSRPEADEIADVVAGFLAGANESAIVDLGSARVIFQWVDEGEFYVPSFGGIGFDCDIDVVPRTVDVYCEAASLLAEKKGLSKSPWLLVWSTSFWRDKHRLGDDVLRHMRRVFEASQFDRVFFLESMDDRAMFAANLNMHRIKA